VFNERLFSMPFQRLAALLGTFVAAAALASPATAAETRLIGLSDNNTLVLFSSVQPELAKALPIQGVSGTLLGIDFRPANGKLYGVSDTNILYIIDPSTGVATQVAPLSVPFTGGIASGLDVNPAADRLRLVGSNTQNFRIVMQDIPATPTSAAIPAGTVVNGGDLPLAYAANDINAGRTPNVTGAGYTDSVRGTTRTKLFDIDTTLDVLVFQDPPNNGTLTTVGPLGVDFAPRTGFDIFVDRNGINAAFAVSNSTLYAIDLGTGRATAVGVVGNGRLNLFGLASLRSGSQ
jgi:hypothetical protein